MRRRVEREGSAGGDERGRRKKKRAHAVCAPSKVTPRPPPDTPPPLTPPPPHPTPPPHTQNALAQVGQGALALEENLVVGLVRNVGPPPHADDRDGQADGQQGQQAGRQGGGGQDAGRRRRRRGGGGEGGPGHYREEERREESLHVNWRVAHKTALSSPFSLFSLSPPIKKTPSPGGPSHAPSPLPPPRRTRPPGPPGRVPGGRDCRGGGGGRAQGEKRGGREEGSARGARGAVVRAVSLSSHPPPPLPSALSPLPFSQAEDASKKRAVAQGVDYDTFCEMVGRRGGGNRGWEKQKKEKQKKEKQKKEKQKKKRGEGKAGRAPRPGCPPPFHSLTLPHAPRPRPTHRSGPPPSPPSTAP